jgi:hypothetical protein
LLNKKTCLPKNKTCLLNNTSCLLNIMACLYYNTSCLFNNTACFPYFLPTNFYFIQKTFYRQAYFYAYADVSNQAVRLKITVTLRRVCTVAAYSSLSLATKFN